VPARAEQVSIRNVKRIVTLGDSITQGGERPGGYVWLIRNYLQVLYPEQKIEVLNAGISGHKSTDMLARFQRDVLDKKPDLVTISVGINDVWHGFTREHPAGYGPRRVTLDDYRKNLEAMVQAAQKAGVDVILLTTTIFEDQPGSIRNLRVASYNDAVRELAAKYGLRVADQFRAFMDAWQTNGSAGAKLTSDQVHMAPAGDALMARTVLLAMGVSKKALERAKPEVEKRLPGR
jgi:acyl-CoA thioesterase I